MYMLIRDNRVLRRQKGKLLRTLKEESSKLVELNE